MTSNADQAVAVAMAPTGCAADVIDGYIWQSCYNKGKSNQADGDDKVSQQTAKKFGENLNGTKLAVLVKLV